MNEQPNPFSQDGTEKMKNDARPVVNHFYQTAKGQNGCAMALVGVVVGPVAICGFVFLVLWLSGMTTINGFFDGLTNLFTDEPATAQVDTTRTLVSSLQPLGQLVSISAEVAKADIEVGINRGGINLCGHSAMHVAEGAIEAGIDMNAIDESHIVYDAEQDLYTLTLPAPQLTSCRIEFIRQYERSGGGGTCNVNWDDARLLAQYVAIHEFAAESVQGGILSRAEREADLLMSNFVSALTGSTVEIVFAQADDTAQLPPSCAPEVPGDWYLDEDANAWRLDD